MTRAFVAASLAVVMAAIVARALGPNDLWDHAQPYTIGYTADILEHGHWVLPYARGEEPATKPPFYNWLAAPAVALAGPTSTVAHKFPSMLALLGAWALLVFAPRGVVRDGACIGAVAGAWYVASVPIFKIGGLARPDMLLTWWTLLGAVAATALMYRAPGRDRRAAGLAALVWGSFACAALTKGPPALIIVLYALVAARVVGGSWRCVARLRWRWGPLLGFAPPLAWVAGVWALAPDHLESQLFGEEVLGRVTGVGAEGGGYGPLRLLTSLPVMPTYLLTRFAPWSLALAGAAFVWWRRRRRSPAEPDRALVSAAWTFIFVVLCFYSLSAGKRADYLAAAYAPAAFLGAWWWLGAGVRDPAFVRTRAAGGLAAAALVLGVIVVEAGRDRAAPAPGFGDQMVDFARAAHRAMAETPEHPVLFCWAGTAPIQPLLGYSRIDGPETVLAELEHLDGPAWVVAGRLDAPPWTFAAWLRTKRPDLDVRAVVESAELPEATHLPVRLKGWHTRTTLYLVEPGRAR